MSLVRVLTLVFSEKAGVNSRLIMLEGNTTAIVLVLIALALAWYSGYRTRNSKNTAASKNSEKDYFIGLNYLVNEKADQSVDELIASLEINATSVESNLALAALTRRRGKFDQSVAVYHKLLADSKLSEIDLQNVKLGLIRSYVAAGLLDRAESLINELRNSNKEVSLAALDQGVIVYQTEKEWLNAIQAIDDLLKICSPEAKKDYQNKASHFYCELAEIDIENSNYSQARSYLNYAINFDRDNVRTSLILADLEYKQKFYKKTLKAINKISTEDLSFQAEVFPLIVASYLALDKNNDLERFIENSIDQSSSANFLLKLIQHVKETKGRNEAKELLFSKLKSNPRIELLGEAILLNSTEGEESAEFFYEILQAYFENHAKYQCGSCGFEFQRLHWLCPSCNEWGRVKPLEFKVDENYL